jgi:hypothetical protein
MIASNFNRIQNHFLIEEVEKLVVQEFVSKEQLTDIKNNNPATKTNSNVLIRIAFFLLGSFLISSVFGVLALFFTLISNQNAFGFLFLLATICFVFTTEFIYKQNYFAFGFDDSLILSIPIFACLSIGLFSENVVAILFVLVLITSLCSLRYVHVPSALFAQIGLVILIGYAITEKNIIPSAYLPIVLFLLSIVFYFLQKNISNNIDYFIYKNVLITIKIFSLILGYASMNYFVVRELSEVLLGFHLAPNEDIPLAILFYFTTFAIPLFYIFYGLKQKDRIFFWIGLLSLALGFTTIRYYYAFLPIEMALILGGSILFIVVYFSIKKIKDKTAGITFNEDKNLTPMAFDVVKNLLINSTVNATVTTAQESPMEFGGGGFSGGGSSSNF